MTFTLAIFAVGAAIIGLAWHLWERGELLRIEQSRNRIAARERKTDAVRAALGRERLLREVRVAMCQQQRARGVWGVDNQQTTLSLNLRRKVAA